MPDLMNSKVKQIWEHYELVQTEASKLWNALSEYTSDDFTYEELMISWNQFRSKTGCICKDEN